MMKRVSGKNILFMIPSLEIGGAELQTLNHVNYLHDNKYNVFLVVLSNKLTLRSDLSIPMKRILVLGELEDGVYQTSTLLRVLKYIPLISQFLRRNRIDVVFAVMNLAHFAARVSKLLLWLRFRNVTLIIYHRCAFFREFPADTVLKKVLNALNTIAAFLLDDYNIFISKDVAKDISNNTYVRKGTVIYNSVKKMDIDNSLAREYLRENSLLSRKYVIVFPGRFHEHKGHALFLKAFKALINHFSLGSEDIVTVLLGRGYLEEKVKEQIVDLNLTNYVHMAGVLPHKMLLSFLKQSDLVVVPSNHEGFGNVAIEALMAKSLLLTSRAGGLKEIIEDGATGITFETGNPSDLLEKLIYVYENRKKQLIDPNKVYQEYENRYSLFIQMRSLMEIME